MQKKVLTPQRVDKFTFPIVNGKAKTFGRDYEFREPTLWREQPVRSEDLREELQRNSERDSTDRNKR